WARSCTSARWRMRARFWRTESSESNGCRRARSPRFPRRRCRSPMSRKTKDITIDAPGRDQGKTFRLTELAAKPAEKWANRVFLALARSGLDLPPNLDLTGGMSGIYQLAQLVGHLRF